jgi:glycosyltransferase involved in cell wall biosynthesis
MPINVCHLVLSLAPGGLENGLVNLVNHFNENRVSSRILCIRKKGEMAERVHENVPVDCLDFMSGFHLKGILAIRQYLRRHAIDILHTRNQAALIWGGLAVVLNPKIKHIHSEHGTPVNSHWLARLLIKKATRLMSVAPVLADDMRHFYRLPNKRVVDVIMNGVDTERFRPVSKAAEGRSRLSSMGGSASGGKSVHQHDPQPTIYNLKAQSYGNKRPMLREELGLPEDTFLFACVGRLDENKNQDLAIRTFRELPAELTSRAALLIIGDGPDRKRLEALAVIGDRRSEAGRQKTEERGQGNRTQGEDERESLIVNRESSDLDNQEPPFAKASADRLGTRNEEQTTDNPPSPGDGEDRLKPGHQHDPQPTTHNSSVFFLGFRDDIPHILPQIDCLLLPSKQEGMSNAILEANACGVPVLASDIPANQALIRQKENGFLLPLDHGKMWENRMKELVGNHDLLRHLGERSRQIVEECFTIPAMVKGYTEMYEKVHAQNC